MLHNELNSYKSNSTDEAKRLSNIVDELKSEVKKKEESYQELNSV